MAPFHEQNFVILMLARLLGVLSLVWKTIFGELEIGEGGQKGPTFGFQINKSWGYNVHHGDYS